MKSEPYKLLLLPALLLLISGCGHEARMLCHCSSVDGRYTAEAWLGERISIYGEIFIKDSEGINTRRIPLGGFDALEDLTGRYHKLSPTEDGFEVISDYGNTTDEFSWIPASKK